MFQQEDFDNLAELTPNVLTCDYTVSLTDEHLNFFTNRWKHLTLLPGWHEDEPRMWVPVLGTQLTKLVIQATVLTAACGYLSSPTAFSSLKTLIIQDGCVDYTNITQLETISKVCPSLTSLSFEIQELPDEDMDLGALQPAPLVTSLSIFNVEPEACAGVWCKYLELKYPNITSLTVSFDGDASYNTLADTTSTLYTLVTSLNDLDALHLDLSDVYSPDSIVFDALEFPRLRQWLNGKSRLSSFSWRCPHTTHESSTDVNHYTMTSIDTLNRLSSLKQDIYDPQDRLMLDCLTLPIELPAPISLFESLVTLDICVLEKSQHLHLDLADLLLRMPNLLHLALKKFSLYDTQNAGGRLAHPHPLTTLHLTETHVITQNIPEPFTLDLTPIVNSCPHLDQLLLHRFNGHRLLIDSPQHSFSRLSLNGAASSDFKEDHVTLILNGKPSSTANAPSSVIKCKAVGKFDRKLCVCMT
ncbi:hypothetical protein DM01DRAFT_1340221 [Hesseltinella vesiculosa]|uniref:RNI-like protein n=1 Tax=Hesseltinella vesiculosa TaxID=101127 RepID=A0A1X2G4M2_9FUNG|nr:hypothetical protein DM01DRAFT_1340221 [Hesseltinella vesiculosa]